MATYAQSGSSPIDVQHYRFEIELSDASDAITARATIRVRFLEPASQLRLDLASTDNDKGMYAFQVKEGKNVLRSNHVNNVLMIDLAGNVNKGDERVIEISYMGTPKDGLIISKNKFGDRTFFGDNWPNRAHQWIPCHDDPSDKASFEFVVTAPALYQVVSNGIKVEEVKMENNRKRTHWKEDIPLPTKVMVIGVAKFAVKEFKDSPAGLPVSAWIYQQDSAKGFYDYGLAPSIVKFFAGYIAPFPYKKLANVQSTTIFGGMENAGAIFYAEESVTGDRKWEEVLAHEIAHQWFGDMASEKSFAHLWLSEGFATYLTDLYIEKKYGKDSADKRLQKERQQVIDFAKSYKHAVVDSTEDLMSLLNANSYQKGGWVLHMLRRQVGDTLFQKILQEYYQQYKGGNAETRDFEAVAESVAMRNLKAFFDLWLYQPEVPTVRVEWAYGNGELKMTVQQLTDKVLQFDLPLAVRKDKALREEFTVQVSQRTQSFTRKVDMKGAEIVLDPFTNLLFSGTVREAK